MDNKGVQIHGDVSDYYGKKLKSSDDLQTNACTANRKNIPKHVRNALSKIHPDVSAKSFGCGMVAPESLEGTEVLDLGCGAGQDVFVLAKLAGTEGHVTGVDMTNSLLDIGRQHTDYHMKEFDFDSSNVEFRHTKIEQMRDADIPNQHYDVAVSNCVINLCPDKEKAFREVYAVLKDGGEMFFSDMYADRVIPDDVRNDTVLWAEGLGGSLCCQDLKRVASEIGFSHPRLISASIINIGNSKLEKLVAPTRYCSATFRLFRLPNKMATACHVTYDGKMEGIPCGFSLDHETTFPKGKPVYADAETTTILKSSRLRKHFTFTETENQTQERVCLNAVKRKPEDTSLPSVDAFALADAGESTITLCKKQ